MPSFPQSEAQKSTSTLSVAIHSTRSPLFLLCPHYVHKEGRLLHPTPGKTSMPAFDNEWEMEQNLFGAYKPSAKPGPMGAFINQVFPKLGQLQQTQNMTDKS